MSIKLFKKEEASVRKISDSYSVANYLTAADSGRVSLAVSIARDHKETTETSSDRAYFILEGEMIVNDNLVGQAGDVIYIPANTEYNFKGTFKTVIVNSPAFRPENESVIKE